MDNQKFRNFLITELRKEKGLDTGTVSAEIEREPTKLSQSGNVEVYP